MMILSWEIPGYDAYRDAAIDLYEVERDIETRQHSKHAIDRKIMPDLLKKRDRLIAIVAPLKAAVDAAEAKLREQRRAATVHSHSPAPAARPASDADLDIPDFLRRKVA
jgi:hypothetical protein